MSVQPLPWPPAFTEVAKRHLSDVADPLLPSMSLMAEGIDSVRLVHFLFDLEDEFSFEMPAERMSAEAFSTLGALWAAISPEIRESQ